MFFNFYKNKKNIFTSMDPTKSIKALKEDRVLTTRLQSHPTSPCYNNITHAVDTNTNTHSHINTNESTHSEMGPVRKTQ